MSTCTFNCAIISLNPTKAEFYSKELARSSAVGVTDCLLEYPSDEVLARLIRLKATDLFLIDCTDLSRALQIIETVRGLRPSVEVLALCEEDVRVLSALMRSSIREYMTEDAPIDLVREALASSIARVQAKPKRVSEGGNVIAFLPGKPGSGASTISAYTALAASKAPNRRVLLVDLDREAPVQAFLNQLHPEHFLQEAFASSHHMDGDIWSRLASKRNELDILPADADGAPCAESGRMQELLRFFRSSYDLTCLDLPGPLDPCSMEVLSEAKRVYLVCTQELASVHIALRKAERLKRLGLDGEIRVVLNRYVASHVMTKHRVADLIGYPVELTIPNSYGLANASAERGSIIDPSTPLGKSYAKLAQILLNDRVENHRKPNNFLQFLYQRFGKLQQIGA